MKFSEINLTNEQIDYLWAEYQSQPKTMEDISNFWGVKGGYTSIEPEGKTIEPSKTNYEWDRLFEELGLTAAFPFVCPKDGGLDGYGFLTMNGVAYVNSKMRERQEAA